MTVCVPAAVFVTDLGSVALLQPTESTCGPAEDLKGIVQVFLKCGHIKSISTVDLFPAVISDQRSLSVEQQRAAPAQTLSFVLQ